MFVHVDDASDAICILLSLDLLGGKEMPDRVANPFRSVGVAFGFDASIEVF
jgi:hypothetical protein